MFTGIVEEMGEIVNQQRAKNSISLSIKAKVVLDDLKVGDSIAINGVCLTVTAIASTSFHADIMPETLRKTNLYELKNGDRVNLERALPAGGRLGGHFVSGHIDGVGTIMSDFKEGNARVVRISSPYQVTRYIIGKGSIAVDGISLTVVEVDKTSFSVSLIPHTAGSTTLGYKKPGDKVNLEADMLGKYIEKFLLNAGEESISSQSHDIDDTLEGFATKEGVSYALLRDKGFL